MDKTKGQNRRVLTAGIAAGAVSGLMGGAGGAILLVLLSRWCRVKPREAFALCVGVMAPVCAMSAAVYLRRGAVDWAAAWPYLLGGLAGGYVAGRTLERVKPHWLKKLFALVLLWGGVRLWL